MQKIKSLISGIFQLVLGAIVTLAIVAGFRSASPEFYTEHCDWTHYLAFPAGCVTIAYGHDGRTLIQHGEMGFGEYSLEITNYTRGNTKFFLPEEILPLASLGYAAELVEGTYNEVILDGMRFELVIKPDAGLF